MANPEVTIDVKLNDDDYKKKVKGISDSLKSFGRELQQVSREMIVIGGAVTGSFTAAFVKAQKDIPAVSNELKSLSNSMRGLSDAVALAALPTLKEFTNLINNVAVNIKSFTETHSALVNSVLKWGGITLAIGLAGEAVGRFVRSFSPLVKGIQTFVALTPILKVQVAAIAGSVLWLAYAIEVLTDKTTTLLTKLASLSPMGFGANLVGLLSGKNASISGGSGGLFTQIQNQINQLFNTSNSPISIATDKWGAFVRGFQSGLKNIQENVEEFGKGLSDVFQKSFSDTLFDAITGKLQGMRSIIKALGEDILRLFLRQGTNALFGKLFGTADNPKSGIFGGGGLSSIVGGVFGRSKLNDPSKTVEKFSDQVSSTTDNLVKFGQVKDALMANMQQLGQVVKGVGQAHITMTQQLAQAWGAMTQGIAQGFGQVISGLQSAVNALLSMLGGRGGGGGWLSWIGAAVGIAGALFTGGGSLLAGLGGLMSGGGLPAGANITMGAGAFTALAEGGIVRRPTLALVGESGPEAVVPLGSKGGFGATRVDINIGTAMLNSPSNMRDFVKLLKEELAR